MTHDYPYTPSSDGTRFRHFSPALRAILEQQEANKIGSTSEAVNKPQPLALQGAGREVDKCLSSVTHHSTPPLRFPIPQAQQQVNSTSSNKTINNSKNKTTKKSVSEAYHKNLPAGANRTPYIETLVRRLGDLSVLWRKLQHYQRFALSGETAGRRGGIAFTLNLSPDQENTLLHHGDPAKHLSRRINKELRKLIPAEFPLQYGFAFDVSPTTGNVHLHGVIIPPAILGVTNKRLKEALAQAGGKINGNAAARQVQFKPITDGVGWAAYSEKDFGKASHLLGTFKVIFISEDLTRLTVLDHKERRAKAKQQIARS